MFNTTLRLSTAVLFCALAGLSSGQESQKTTQEPARRNWAENYEYKALRIHVPQTVADVQEIVRNAPGKVKARGTRHSFTDIADTTGDLVSMERFDKLIKIDRQRRQVTVEGGMRYGELSQKLHEAGFALRNLASLPHISVAGACSTGTHGSGDKVGSLATEVAAIEFVAADGSLVTLSREENPDEFPGAVVSLGALGIITKVTLDIEPTYCVAQYVYQDLPFDALERHFDEIMGRSYSTSLFMDWSESISEVWLKCRVDEGRKPELENFNWFGAKPATRKLHPVISLDPIHCTDQLGVPGPWFERLPHFKLEFTPSVGHELHSEFFVAKKDAWAALKAVQGIRDRIQPLLYITEIRTIAEDDLWLSMAYGRDSISIQFTWKPETEEVLKLLPLLEETLAPYAARPHWGKISKISAEELEARYPRMKDFRALLKKYDPKGKFRNDYIERRIFGAR